MFDNYSAHMYLRNIKLGCKLLTVFMLLWQLVLGKKAITSELHTELFQNYKPQLLPVCKLGGFVNVSIDIALRQIVNLDEKDQVLTTNVWVRMGWTDCQLVWNTSQYNDVKELRVTYKEVWTPDLALYDSSAEEEMMPGRTDYQAQLSSDGTVEYKFPTVLKSICRVKVAFFPFDEQVCNLKFGSWSYTSADLDIYPKNSTVRLRRKPLAYINAHKSASRLGFLTSDTCRYFWEWGDHNSPHYLTLGDLTNFIENNEWIVTDLMSERTVKKYESGIFTDVSYKIVMKRRHDFYVMTLMFPCILVSAIAAIGFLLPPESGEKVSLEVTVLLSQAVFLLVISDFLPPSAESFPVLGTYFAISMLLVSLSLVLAVLVLNVHHRGDVPGKKVPGWMRKVFLELLGTCCRKPHKNAQCYRRRSVSITELPNGDVNSHEMGTFDDICQQTQSGHQERINSISSEQYYPNIPGSNQNSDLGRLNYIAHKQLHVLNQIEKHFATSDDSEDDREDWQRLARVLDRIFLALYLTAFSTITLVFVLRLMDQGGDT